MYRPNVRPYIVFFLFDFTRTKPNEIFSTCQDLVKDIIRHTLPFQQVERTEQEGSGAGKKSVQRVVPDSPSSIDFYSRAVFDFEAAKPYAINATLTW